MPILAMNPADMELAIYAEIMPLPHLVPGTGVGPAFVHGPMTLCDTWTTQNRERALLERALDADHKQLQRALDGVLHRRVAKTPRWTPFSDAEMAMLRPTLNRFLFSHVAKQMADLRQLRTYASLAQLSHARNKTLRCNKKPLYRARPVPIPTSPCPHE